MFKKGSIHWAPLISFIFMKYEFWKLFWTLAKSPKSRQNGKISPNLVALARSTHNKKDVPHKYLGERHFLWYPASFW